MGRAVLAVVALTTSLALFAACGGPSPPTQTPALGASAVAVDPAAPPPATPTTTTTQTVGGAGGTKLTPLGSADGGADGGAKHHGEIGRTVADLRAIVSSHHDEARACYDNALAAHPGIEGNIDVRWTIDPAGNVTDADIDTSHSDIIEPAVGNCIIAVIKKIHFNVSAKGFETKAHYPFNFHPRAHHSVSGN